MHLRIHSKQIVTNISKHNKNNNGQIAIPTEILSSFEVFSTPNLSITQPNSFKTQGDKAKYINDIQQELATENNYSVHR